MTTLRNLIVLSLSLVLLQGCIAVVAGGAAAGGYYAGKDERSVGQIAEDSANSTSIKTRLIADSDIKARDINVDVRNNVATLRGQVYTPAQRSAAIQIAKETKGISRVVSELKVVDVEVQQRS